MVFGKVPFFFWPVVLPFNGDSPLPFLLRHTRGLVDAMFPCLNLSPWMTVSPATDSGLEFI